jgi:hypothetical protein
MYAKKGFQKDNQDGVLREGGREGGREGESERERGKERVEIG